MDSKHNVAEFSILIYRLLFSWVSAAESIIIIKDENWNKAEMKNDHFKAELDWRR